MAGLEGELHVPGMGAVQKKYVIGGVLVGAGIGVIVYFRSKSKAAQAATANTATGGTVTDPAGNTCSVLDPNSGYCPGSPEDAAYQESLSGSYSGVGFNGGEFGGGTGVSLAGLVTDPAGNQCSAVNPATGFCPGSPQDVAASGTGAGSGTGGTITSNTDWLNAALGVVPGDTNTVHTALASVLGGLTVTTAQKNLFNEAVGILGPPPQGYPQPIKTSDTSAQPGSGSGSSSKAGAISNLQASSESSSGFTVHWNPAKGASQGYKWTVTGGGISKSGNTKSTSASVSGLHGKTTYNFGVQGLPGGPGNNIHVTTK